MTQRPLPPSASVAEPREGDRLFAPSAARNAGPIAELLADVAPTRGRALEIASGTGQHVVTFAARLPGLTWQPTEPDAARRASIDAHARDAGRANILAARPLDACTPGWAAAHGGQHLIVLCNLLHLVPMDEALALLDEVPLALAPGGRFVVYGPFRRAGRLTSDGDARFDAELRAADPRIGYKEIDAVRDRLAASGLTLVEIREMPANNLALVAKRP